MLNKIIETSRNFEIPLHRAGVFKLVILAGVVLLTTVNNYAFYTTLEKKTKTEIINLRTIVNEFSSTCVEASNGNIDYCVKKIHSMIEILPTYYGTSILIKDNNKELINEDTSKYKDIREPIALSAIAEEEGDPSLTKINSLNATIEIIKRPIPNLAKSVWRSMTFSVLDLIVVAYNKGYDDVKWYASNVSWPRSRHVILAGGIVWWLAFFLRKSLIAKIKFARRYEEKNELN
jgi:hypothetical protein